MDLAEGHNAAADALLKEDSEVGVFKVYNLGTGSGSSVLQVWISECGKIADNVC